MIRLSSTLAALVCLAAGTAAAADYPSEPVHLIVPYAPGGNVDAAARILADQLGQSLHQPFIVENKPGAAGIIAGQYVAHARPDGYTILIGSNAPLVLAPLLYVKPPYDPVKTFAPISTLAFTPTLLVTGAVLPVTTVKEFFERARQHPGELTVSVDAVGSINHVASELLQRDNGVTWRSVHYRGNAEGVTDLIAGHIDGAITQITVVSGEIKAGKLRALAVLGPDRIADLPSVPTLGEAGYKPVNADAFAGLAAPIRTPRAVIDLLSKATADALAKPEVQAKFKPLGIVARASTPQAFADYLRQEAATLGPVIKAAHITTGD
jgi:tripartite-type tricarboxylate transporter receptor subunit TctC